MNTEPFLHPIDFTEEDMLHGADLLISDLSNYTVALRYDETICEAPVVVAKGLGATASRLEAEARQRNILILQNTLLACELFAMVPVLGMEVPETLYEEIGKAYAYAYTIQNNLT